MRTRGYSGLLHSFSYIVFGALLLVSATTVAQPTIPIGKIDQDQFRLWNECKPMAYWVHIEAEEATLVGLEKDNIETAVRSRLRAARLLFAGADTKDLDAILAVILRVIPIT